MTEQNDLVKRYTVTENPEGIGYADGASESEKGEFVWYADHIREITRLQAELEREKQLRIAAVGMADKAYEENEGLQAELSATKGKLAKVIKAAEHLDGDAVPCACHDCIEARIVLAEIKGE